MLDNCKYENIANTLFTVQSFPSFKYYLLIFLILIFVKILIEFYLYCMTFLYKKRIIWSTRKIIYIRSITALLIITFAVASIFGFTIGEIAGNSRKAISDAVISGSVTIYGALVVYWFTRSKLRTKLTSSLSLIAFCIYVSYGMHVGSVNRVHAEECDRLYNEEFIKYESNIKIEEYSRMNLIDLQKKYRMKELDIPNE